MNVEEPRRMLADDLKALQDGKSVLGVGEMADEVEKLGSPFTANAQRIRSYENATRRISASRREQCSITCISASTTSRAYRPARTCSIGTVSPRAAEGGELPAGSWLPRARTGAPRRRQRERLLFG